MYRSRYILLSFFICTFVHADDQAVGSTAQKPLEPDLQAVFESADYEHLHGASDINSNLEIQ